MCHYKLYYHASKQHGFTIGVAVASERNAVTSAGPAPIAIHPR